MCPLPRPTLPGRECPQCPGRARPACAWWRSSSPPPCWCRSSPAHSSALCINWLFTMLLICFGLNLNLAFLPVWRKSFLPWLVFIHSLSRKHSPDWFKYWPDCWVLTASLNLYLWTPSSFWPSLSENTRHPFSRDNEVDIWDSEIVLHILKLMLVEKCVTIPNIERWSTFWEQLFRSGLVNVGAEMTPFIAEEQPIVNPPLLLCGHQEFQKHSMTKKFNLHEIGKSNNI